MKIKSQKDFWSGVMFVVMGVAFAWGATNYNFGSSARPGPGYLPIGSPSSVSITSDSNRMKAPSSACKTPRPNGK